MAQDRDPAAQAVSPVAQTIAALATPPGEGALAVVRLAGPDALGIALELTGRTELEARKATFVTIPDLDEGIAVYYPGASSPIGEEMVELIVHGGAYVTEQLLGRALKRASLAMPGEFTQRAFLNGKLDLAQAEAVCSLIKARTQTSHRAALRQLAGGLSQAVRACREPLFELLVRVEACLDHPEEDIPSLSCREAAAALARARAPIEALAATYRLGRLAAQGARLALVGSPNAGKSSLFNALLGRGRAIVRPEPGTTRDTIEEAIEVGGLPAVLIDTAGLRDEGADEAEREGIRRADEALDSCDVAVLVIDGAREARDEDRRVAARVLERAARRGTPVVAALNKADLGAPRAQAPEGFVAVSAAAGTGLDALRGRIAERLGASGGCEAACVTSARQHAALSAALAELDGAAVAARSLGSAWEDRAAFHLREAVRELGLILGEGAGDETLRAVFSRFCVGK